MISEGDDGSFQRAPRRDDPNYEPSRSEADSSWRRGGGGGGAGPAGPAPSPPALVPARELPESNGGI